MYIPKHFEQKDISKALAFMQEYNFAVLISSNDDLPVATHLPFVIEERDNQIVLISHMSKANNQWKSLKDKTLLVIFSEPHAYISPSLYEKQQNVPTWNYVAVHVYGKMNILENTEQKLEVLYKQMQFFEAAYIDQFKSLDQKYIDGLLNGIVAFEISVSDIQAKEKLSQNKTETERRNIKKHLSESPDSIKQDLGKRMPD